MLSPVRGLDPYSKALYFERKTFLNGLLVVEDRVSMAHSLEARVPFLDNGLADLAGAYPVRSFCAAAARASPCCAQPPPGCCPRRSCAGRSRDSARPTAPGTAGRPWTTSEPILLDDRSLSRGWFEPDAVRRTISEHIEGRVNHRLLLWSLLSFEWWNRLFLDGELPAAGHSPARHAAGSQQLRRHAAAHAI